VAIDLGTGAAIIIKSELKLCDVLGRRCPLGISGKFSEHKVVIGSMNLMAKIAVALLLNHMDIMEVLGISPEISFVVGDFFCYQAT